MKMKRGICAMLNLNGFMNNGIKNISDIAGRGFFHINAAGGAEPCPFSPYSEMNLSEQSLLTILQSPFFEKVREISGAEALNHKGGCTLFQYENEVKQAIFP